MLDLRDLRAAGGPQPPVRILLPLVSISLVYLDGSEAAYAVPRHQCLAHTMEDWMVQKGMPRGSVRFMLDGNTINENQTPEQLDMEDGDVIYIMQHQARGGIGGRAWG